MGLLGREITIPVNLLALAIVAGVLAGFLFGEVARAWVIIRIIRDLFRR